MERVALITGASRGLGATLAQFLAEQGYGLVLTARDATRLDHAAARLSDQRGRLETVAGDLADGGHTAQLVAALRSFGHLDLLVNNASELGPTPLPPLATYPPQALERVLGVNVVAPLRLIQAAIPYLERAGRREGGTGSLVVNISSDAASGGYPGWGGYGASKAALDLLSLTLGNELTERGIGVVSVDPGDMRTAMHQAAFPGEDISDRPLPEVTLPFWAWLLGRSPAAVSGRRYRAQAANWEVAS